MIKKIKGLKYHIIFWSVVIISISFLFGHSWGNVFAAFCYVAILSPIVIAVVYFFNFYLVPRYLFTRKYLKFSVYSAVTIAISLLLESYLILFSFIWLANFNFHNIAPNASDTMLLFAVLYLFVFAVASFLLYKQLSNANKVIDQQKSEKKKESKALIEIVSNRKKINVAYADIFYIESLSDYIVLHTKGGELKSKERISKIEARLPKFFVRIHRAFIVNNNHITKYSSDELIVNNDAVLPIGRSFKQNVKSLFAS